MMPSHRNPIIWLCALILNLEEDLDEETPEEPVRLPAVRRDGDDRALRWGYRGIPRLTILQPTPRPPHIRIPFAQTRLRRARKTVRSEPLMSASMEARIAEHAAAPTPPLPVASSPLPLPSPLTTSPTDAGAPLGYRAAGIRMRAAAASPPLSLPSTSLRTDVPEAEMPPRRVCLTTPTPGCEIGESSVAGAARQPRPTLEVDTWDEIVKAIMEIAPTTLEGVDQEEPYHRHTALALDREAVYARIAWTSSEERSAAIEAHVRILEAQKMPPTRRTMRTTPTTTTTPTITVIDAQLQALIDQGVAAALAERDASRSRDGDNSHGLGTGGRRQVPTQRECTYTDFLKCQPINFKGTEGVVGLTQWVEKMESVFLISNCAITSQVKYASCTLQGSALTWWNSHVRAIGQDVAYTMPWTALKRIITDKYCPRGEIKKLESEYWNLKNVPCDHQNGKGMTVFFPDMFLAVISQSKPQTKQDCRMARSLQDNCPKLKNGNQGIGLEMAMLLARAYVCGLCWN
ncbi:hypothetical protein Tco_1256756 [Tanacetum coccineum]